MAKIVIDARIINSSTGRYIKQMLSYLEKLDVTNEYTVLVPTKDMAYWVSRNKNFTLVASDYASYSFGEQIGFCWQLYRLKADLVHYCMPQQPLLYFRPHVSSVLDLTLFKISPSHKNPLIFRLKQFIGRGVFYIIGHTSKHILTISNFTRNEYSRFAHVPHSRITTTHLAAEALATKSIRPQVVSTNTPYILFVGQQNEHKNVRGLILAHQELLKKHPKLQLVLAGKVKDEVLVNRKWVEHKNYRNIIFTDYVSDEQLVWLYQHTKACVVPAFLEGFGLPGLEAMIHQAPVVSSNTSCLPEIYGDAAIYFNPYDIDDMVKSISTVVENGEMRKTLVARGKKQVKKFSWKRMAEQTLEVYNKVLEEN